MQNRNFKNMLILSGLCGLFFLIGCDPAGNAVNAATKGGTKAMVETKTQIPISNIANGNTAQFFNDMQKVLETADIGFDTFKNNIGDWFCWKSSQPAISAKMEVLQGYKKSLVDVNIHNYPAYPSGEFVYEMKKTFEEGVKTSENILVITPQKSNNTLLLITLITIGTIQLLFTIFIFWRKK